MYYCFNCGLDINERNVELQTTSVYRCLVCGNCKEVLYAEKAQEWAKIESFSKTNTDPLPTPKKRLNAKLWDYLLCFLDKRI